MSGTAISSYGEVRVLCAMLKSKTNLEVCEEALTSSGRAMA